MKSIIKRYRSKCSIITNNTFITNMLLHAPRYFSASFINAFIGLIMTKYYTYMFSPDQFGKLALYTSLFTYMIEVVGLSMDSSSQRVYFDYRESEREKFISTVIISMIISSTFWITILLLFSRIITKYLDNHTMYYIVIGMIVVHMYLRFMYMISYSEKQSKLVFRQSLLQAFVNHGLSFFFIGLLRIGIMGRLLGQFIAYLINLISMIINLGKHGFVKFKLVFSFDILKKVLYFSLTGLCTSIMISSLTYLDRIFLIKYHSSYEVGIYSLGCTLGQALSLIIEAVSTSILPSIITELKEDYTKNISKLRQFNLLFCIFLILLGLIAYIFKDLIIFLFANTSYKGAGVVLTFILFGSIMGGFYKVPASVLSFHNIVWFYPIVSAVSFGINALLNFLLIPKYSVLGAAFATFIGMLIYSFIIQMISSRYLYKKSYILLAYGLMLFISFIMFLSFI